MKQTEQIIYGDVLFAVNFSMDFLALYFTSQILHLKTHLPFSVISAATGSIYSIFLLTANIVYPIELFLNIAIAFLMCYICFRPKKLPFLFKYTLLYFAVNFLLGGCMTTLYSFINRTTGRTIVINGNPSLISEKISSGIFAVLALTASVVALIIGKILKNRHTETETDVTVVFGSRQCTVHCLSDSGNLLTDLSTGLPVIITDFRKIKSVLPLEMRHIFKSGNISEIEKLPLNLLRRMRIIPFKSISDNNGTVLGFIPDFVLINNEKKHACIGINTGGDGNYGGCEGILPTSILK